MRNTVLADTDQREYGVDRLKSMAMFMVPVLHILGRGGIFESVAEFSTDFFTT